MPVLPSSDVLWRDAVSVLESNDSGVFVKPGPRQYPGQWNWDAALITIGLAHIDPVRARDEVRSLLKGQWSNGMVPHIVFHQATVDYFPGPTTWGASSCGVSGVPTSAITQPPLLATAVRILHELHPSTDFLEEVVPSLERWHRWFQGRRLDGDGLVTIIHPWESGMDNSPRFDSALREVPPVTTEFSRRDVVHVPPEQRPSDAEYEAYVSILESLRACGYSPALSEAEFLLGDVFLTSILSRAEDDLAALHEVLGAPGTEARSRSESFMAALDGCWNEDRGLFVDHERRRKTPVPITVAGITPLLTGLDTPRVARLVEALDDPQRFGPAPDAQWYPTSVAKSDPSFQPRCYWRGPVWANVNWLLVRGLESSGRPERAEALRMHTLDLVARHGYWEYYDPRSGQGLGSENFSWTAAVVLDLIARPVSPTQR